MHICGHQLLLGRQAVTWFFHSPVIIKVAVVELNFAVVNDPHLLHVRWRKVGKGGHKCVQVCC